MKKTSVIVSAEDWSAVLTSLFTKDGCENAGVFLCGIADSEMERRLLVRRFVPVPLADYLDRQPYHLEVSPRFYNGVVDTCERQRMSPVIIHSHPHSDDAWYSESDNFGEGRLLPVLESLLPNSFPGSLVATPTAVTGRIHTAGEFLALSSLRIMGRKSKIVNFVEKEHLRQSSRYDRQLLAFGKRGQSLLEQLRVGIVGVGGTGSLLAEQLARIGVEDFILIDDDFLEMSNVSRVFGSNTSSVGKRKVDVVGNHITSLGATKVKKIDRSAIRQKVLLLLRDRDVVFSCVDNDRTRAILNRFSYQYLVPLIDLGTRLDARKGQIEASAGRVVIAGYGLTCLRCSHYISSERILAESLPKEERQALAHEGYLMGIDEPVPAVVSLNTTVAGLAVTAAVNLFINLTGDDQPLAQHYDAKRGIVFTAAAVHDPGCDICDPSVGLKGLGDLEIVSSYAED